MEKMKQTVIASIIGRAIRIEKIDDISKENNATDNASNAKELQGSKSGIN